MWPLLLSTNQRRWFDNCACVFFSLGSGARMSSTNLFYPLCSLLIVVFSFSLRSNKCPLGKKISAWYRYIRNLCPVISSVRIFLQCIVMCVDDLFPRCLFKHSEQDGRSQSMSLKVAVCSCWHGSVVDWIYPPLFSTSCSILYALHTVLHICAFVGRTVTTTALARAVLCNARSGMQ